MVSNQEALKTPIQDNVVLPKQLENFYRKGYEIFYNEEMLSAIWSGRKLPAKVVKTELDFFSFAQRINFLVILFLFSGPLSICFTALLGIISSLFSNLSLALAKSTSRHCFLLFSVISLALPFPLSRFSWLLLCLFVLFLVLLQLKPVLKA